MVPLHDIRGTFRLKANEPSTVASLKAA